MQQLHFYFADRFDGTESGASAVVLGRTEISSGVGPAPYVPQAPANVGVTPSSPTGDAPAVPGTEARPNTEEPSSARDQARQGIEDLWLEAEETPANSGSTERSIHADDRGETPAPDTRSPERRLFDEHLQQRDAITKKILDEW